jgi:23S rRNA (uracil1939-C5)-methyltransferase
LKQHLCERLLRDALKGDPPTVAPTLGGGTGPDGAPWGYRNKVHFVCTDDGGGLALGHFRRYSNAVLPVTTCPVHAADGNAIAFEMAGELRRAGVPAATTDAQRGTLRHLVVRVAAATSERLVTAVVRRPDRRVPGALVRSVEGNPQISVHLNVHDGDDPYLFGDTTRKVTGRERLREQIGDIAYLISPTAFFQTNVAAAATLVRVVLAAVPADASTVIDLYAGAGLFALPLAKRGARVTAIEQSTEAVDDGVAARKLNGIAADRCRFIAARVDDAIKRLPLRGAIDAVVLDPPRSGCGDRVLRQIATRLQPVVLVYVSCNPATLATDLAIARTLGYRTERVQPVDMFPHTAHIEAVAILRRRMSQAPRHT